MSLDRPKAEDPYAKLPQVASFTVSSADVADGQPMAATFVYDGAADGAQNRSPQLAWQGFPAETKSFVVTCFDPDAPTPSGFWHWALVDLPVDTTSLPQGAGTTGASLPGSAFHVRNDWSSKDYGVPSRPTATGRIAITSWCTPSMWTRSASTTRRPPRWCRSTWSSTRLPGPSWYPLSSADR